MRTASKPERPPRVVFVAGVSRSGSTLLDFILGNRPGGLALGEIYAWYRPFRRVHLDPECTCGEPLGSCPLWRQVGRPQARHLYRTLADSFDLNVLVDSSKNLNWIRNAYRWAAVDRLEPHVVLSWRRSQMIAYSYWKRGVADAFTLQKPRWMTNLEGYVRRLDDLQLGYHVVAFEQLIREPVRTLDRLHTTIGMDAWPGQERFSEGRYHSMFGSAGTKVQLSAPVTRLQEPELPPEFLEYWDRLPTSWRESLAELDNRMLGRLHVPAGPPRLPPAWYFKSRWYGCTQELRVRWAARS